jgi:hypothetical protein
MKSLKNNNTLVMAVAMILWATASMAGEVSNLPIGSSEKDTINASAAASPAPLFALSGLDAETLAEQEMTDQELKAVEGGFFMMGWCFGCESEPYLVYRFETAYISN